MTSSSHSLNTLLVQTAPHYCDPNRTLKEIHESFSNSNCTTNDLNDLDLILFPELGISGYTFRSKKEVEDAGVLEVLEVVQNSDSESDSNRSLIDSADSSLTLSLENLMLNNNDDPRFRAKNGTLKFMKELAKTYNCYVVYSCPEAIVEVIKAPSDSESNTVTDPESNYIKFNIISHHISQIVIDGNAGLGDIVELTTRSGRIVRICGMCICLDLLHYWNKKEESNSDPESDYSELSNRFLELTSKESDLDVVLFSTAEPFFDEVDCLDYVKESSENSYIRDLMKFDINKLKDSDSNINSKTVDEFLSQDGNRDRLFEWMEEGLKKMATTVSESDANNPESYNEFDIRNFTISLRDYYLSKLWLCPLKRLVTEKFKRNSNSNDNKLIYLCCNRTGKETVSTVTSGSTDDSCYFAGFSSIYELYTWLNTSCDSNSDEPNIESVTKGDAFFKFGEHDYDDDHPTVVPHARLLGHLGLDSKIGSVSFLRRDVGLM